MSRWLLLPLLFLSGLVHAQGQTSAGDYQVHYNALPSAFLTPEIAREYGILRSRVRGVLVVSIQRDGQPVRMRIEAQVGPLGEQMQPLELRQVDTNGLPSYIGSFTITPGESRQFRLRIAPPQSEPLDIGFTQQFFETP